MTSANAIKIDLPSTPVRAQDLSEKIRSLASLDAWELVNRENEALQYGQIQSWLGTAIGTVDYFLRGDTKTQLHDHAEKWRQERELVSSVKGLILRNEATTIREALGLVQQRGSAELKVKASYYLSPERRITKGDPLGALIDYGSGATDTETARLLLQRAFELEYESKAPASALSLYRLVKRYSPEAALQAQAQEHIQAHEGKSSFSRGLQKAVFSTSGEELALDVLIFKGASKTGKFTSGVAERLAKKAGLSQAGQWFSSKASHFLAEGHALFAGNTIKAASLQNPDQVLTKESVAKSYKSNFLMLGVMKLFGKLGSVAGMEHVSGVAGMIASTQANQALGYKEKPKGGNKEAIAQDLVSYLAFGIANSSKAQASEKAPELSLDFHRFGQKLKGIALMPAYGFVSAGGVGGGSRRKTVAKAVAEDSLFEKVRQDPENAELWQVYADHLLERGDIRGEHIQIGQMLSSPNLPVEQRQSLETRKAQIERQWTEQFKERGFKDLGLELKWDRGYIESIQFRKKPSIENLLEIVNAPEASLLKSINLSALRIGMDDITPFLAESPNLNFLRNLNLGYNSLTAEDVRPLAESANLKSLVNLNLERNQIGNEGARILSQSPHLKSLTSLNLMANDIGAEGARALAESGSLQSLTSLNLGQNRIGEIGVRALAESYQLKSLTNLDLYCNQIGAEGARALAESPHLKSLTSLNLKSNGIGAEGARALAESPHLKSLTYLDLGFNRIGDEGARALANSANLKSLKDIVLTLNEIGEAGARALAQSPNLRSLEALGLNLNQIGNEGARALAESSNLRNLVALGVRENYIGAEAIKTLRESPNFPNMEYLNFR